MVPLHLGLYGLEDNIKMDLNKIGWDGMDWIHLAEAGDSWWAVMYVIMNLEVP